jgi:polysaccharide biosynthesis protein PelF
MIEVRLNSEAVDIILIAEGTYPFERGGVASWIYDIISNMPDYKFGIIFLGAFEGQYNDYAYPISPNVVHLQIVYLFGESSEEEMGSRAKNNHFDFERIAKLHEVFKNSHGCPKGLVESIEDIGRLIESDGFDYYQFLRSEDAWNFITEQYSKYSTNPSFINYFWNIRNMHAPLWIIGEAIEKAPKAKVIHTISTGYAGLLAAMLNQRFDYPLILSEHGIYTKERNIELLQSTILIGVDMLVSSRKTFTYQHELWLKFFDSLARMCYHYADLIVSLYSGAQKQQIFAGADKNKARVIPNGIDINLYLPVRRASDLPIPKVVCFVGRFVRIKDIKTFIRSVSLMIAEDNTIEAWIRMVGGGDKDYLDECMDYISQMDLTGKIIFIEDTHMPQILSKIGLLILSSISEGMPLVLLESMAAGIPVIATDVGACREIIEGRDSVDKSIGRCGEIVSIADANMLASAAVKFLNDEALWRSAHRACIERVEKYYNQPTMIKLYKEIYQKAILHGRDRI